eukprot:7261129-Alexandrium_andersonii.AAC.1
MQVQARDHPRAMHVELLTPNQQAWEDLVTCIQPGCNKVSGLMITKHQLPKNAHTPHEHI